jgi:hypothetical protein
VPSSHWRDRCRRVIREADEKLPEDATLNDRKKALRAVAGEFYCPGTSWPSQVWQQERRAYLARFGEPVNPKLNPKLAQLAAQGDITFPFRKEGNP